MKQVYCITHVFEDDNDGEDSHDTYVLASNADSAVNRGQMLFGTSARFSCTAVANADWTEDLARECVRSVLEDNSDDRLLLFVLTKYPTLIDENLIADILDDDLPKSFQYAIQKIPLKKCRNEWLEWVVQFGDVEALDLFLRKGMRDNGAALAQACANEDHDMFETLYSKSNPRLALEHTQCKNLHWIEERLAQEQKQRIGIQVQEPYRTTQRKM